MSSIYRLQLLLTALVLQAGDYLHKSKGAQQEQSISSFSSSLGSG